MARIWDLRIWSKVGIRGSSDLANTGPEVRIKYPEFSARAERQPRKLLFSVTARGDAVGRTGMRTRRCVQA